MKAPRHKDDGGGGWRKKTLPLRAKSAQVIVGKADKLAPLRKRVRKRKKIQGLQGCDKRERTCEVSSS